MRLRKANEKLELKLPKKTPTQVLEERLRAIEKKLDKLLKESDPSLTKK